MEKLEAEKALWEEYFVERSTEGRNRLFLFYSDWVKKIASYQYSKLKPKYLTWSDFVQIGSLALLDCLGRYRPDVGVPFEGFAVKRIKGALINELVKQTQIQEPYQDERIYTDSNEDYFDSFVEGVLDAAFSELLEMSSRTVLDATTDPLNSYMDFREELTLRKMIYELREDLQFVLESHYFNFLSFAQIAQILGVSRARVSQIHHMGLRELRKLFEKMY